MHLHLCIVLHLHSCRSASTSSPAFVQCASLQCCASPAASAARINIQRSSFASKAMAVACCTAGAFCILHKTFAKSSRHDASSSAKPLATLQTASWPQAAINKLQSKLMHFSYRSNLIKMIHLGRFSQCSALLYRNNNLLTLKDVSNYGVLKLNYAGRTWHLMLVDEPQLAT